MLRSLSIACAIATSLCAPIWPAMATPTLYQGRFDDDDQVFATAFTVTATGFVAARTLSYGGGVAGDGTAIGAGGFAPVLSLFSGAGELMIVAPGTARTCAPGSGSPDPGSGFCWDSSLGTSLVAGDYILVLSQDGNLPLGPALADGFLFAGVPDYTGQLWLGTSGHRFVDADGSQREGGWAFELSRPDRAAVSEPATAGLLATALALAAAHRRGRRLHRGRPAPRCPDPTP